MDETEIVASVAGDSAVRGYLCFVVWWRMVGPYGRLLVHQVHLDLLCGHLCDSQVADGSVGTRIRIPVRGNSDLVLWLL